MNMRANIRQAAQASGSAKGRAMPPDWVRVSDDLETQGSAVFEKLLSQDECKAIAALYGDDAIFRGTTVMARHGFGKGEYKYFAYPLPEPIGGLRDALYERLALVANGWN